MEDGLKDITIGFTVAGVVAVFVPESFFQTLFVSPGGGQSVGALAVLEHALVGPLVAVLTFIGSMGNIPLASILAASGVSFAGVMAFIYSDLIVSPVVRISAQYFGRKLAFYIAGVLLASVVATAFTLYGAFALLGILPRGRRQGERRRPLLDRLHFLLNLAFLPFAAVLVWLHVSSRRHAKNGAEAGDAREDREENP